MKLKCPYCLPEAETVFESDFRVDVKTHIQTAHPAEAAQLGARNIFDAIDHHNRSSTNASASLAPPHVPTPGNPFRLSDMQPLRDRILVQPLAMSSRVAGGLLHAPEQSHQREKPQTGLVISIGPGIRSVYTGELVPMVNHPGDVVFYGKYSGQQFDLGDQSYLNMAEIEVFARLPGGTFTIVEHEKAKDWHLLGDYCDQCASPEEKAAKESLQKDREALVAASRLRNRPGMPPDLSIADARDVANYGTPADEEQPAPVPERDPAAAKSALEDERERMRQLRRAAENVEPAVVVATQSVFGEDD